MAANCQRMVMRHADDSAAYLGEPCTCGKCDVPRKADLPLIAWDEVPEGHYVWFRGPNGQWLHGAKRLGILIGPGNLPYYASDIPHLEFCAAEQQPGEWAALRDDLEEARVQLAGCLTAAEGATALPAKQGDYGWSLAYQRTVDLAVAHQRLLDGLAALEQEMREHYASGQPAFDFQLQEWVERLAALREGR